MYPFFLFFNKSFLFVSFQEDAGMNIPVKECTSQLKEQKVTL